MVWWDIAQAAAPIVAGALFGNKTQEAPDYMGQYRQYVAGLDPIMDDPTETPVYRNIESALSEQARLGLSEGAHRIADAYSARGLGQSGMLGGDMSRMISQTEASKAGTMAQAGQNIWQTDVDRRLRQEAMGANVLGVQAQAGSQAAGYERERQISQGQSWAKLFDVGFEALRNNFRTPQPTETPSQISLDYNLTPNRNPLSLGRF